MPIRQKRGGSLPAGPALVAAGGALAGPAGSMLESLYRSLTALDYRSPRTWLFLYLAFTIGAELAPSSTDVRLGVPALLALSAATALLLMGIYQLEPDAPLRMVVLEGLHHGLARLTALLSFALVTTAAVLALTFLPATLLRTARG